MGSQGGVYTIYQAIGKMGDDPLFGGKFDIFSIKG